MFLKLFLNAMIGNIKIHNIPNIIEISKSTEPNKCIPKKNYENIHWWVQENQGVMFLVVPPKDRIALGWWNILSTRG